MTKYTHVIVYEIVHLSLDLTSLFTLTALKPNVGKAFGAGRDVGFALLKGRDPGFYSKLGIEIKVCPGGGCRKYPSRLRD